MHTPPRVYFKIYPKRSACTYYRIEVPLRTMRSMAIARTNSEWDDSIPLSSDDVTSMLTDMLNHDVVMYYAGAGSHVEHVQNLIKKVPCEAFPDGTIVTPPSYFEDFDDNIDYIHPLNSKFAELGTRLENGEKLVPGETVRIVLPDNSVIPLWIDGITECDKHAFSIKRNLKENSRMHKILRKSDGVSFTTERLRDYYVKASGLVNTYVFPNSVVFSDYPNLDLKRPKGKIRILWQGGASHYPDWFSIREGIVEVAKRFPEVQWVIWGVKYDWIHGKIPADQFEFHDWVPYEAYKIKLASLNFDIAIAPLVDNIFNRGKSCIKWYEVTALAEPRPIVAANVPPYSDEIQDGVTGMLYSNEAEFVEKLSNLVTNRKLRMTLASNSKDWINEHRRADITVPPYAEWLLETHARLQKRKRKAHLRRVLPTQVSRA